jgi:hypothetical protein
VNRSSVLSAGQNLEEIADGNVNISDHADDELANDAIEDNDLYFSIIHDEVIEDYA